MTKYNTSKKEDVVIYKVDISKHEALPKRFGIKGVPALVFINKNGEIKSKEIGIRTSEEIKSKVIEYFK